jgi:hypothetical protein
MLPDIGTDLEPVDPTRECVYADYYDKPMGWQSESITYSRDLRKWRMKNLQRIRNLNYEELKGWKLRYKQNEYRQRQKLGHSPDHTFIEAEDEEFGLPVIEADERNDRPKSTNIFIGDTVHHAIRYIRQTY